MKVKNIDEILWGGVIRESQNFYLKDMGWYRIAVSPIANPATGIFEYGKNMMISLTRSYGGQNNEAYLISFTAAYQKPQFKTLNSVVNFKLFDKIRCVILGNNIYIEVHYSRASPNGMTVGIYGQSKFKPSDPIFTALPFEPADDTAKVLVEQEI